jgi:putative lipoic acid-binding regulatory protein
MNREQSIELLNATHDFPCEYTFKVIGSSRDEFVGRVVAVVRQAMGPDQEVPYSTRKTPAGKHVAVTLQPTVASAEQVLDVYGHIATVSGIVLTM